MAKNVGNRMSRILALLGTILCGCRSRLTLLTAAIGSIGRRSFHMDYLMPGELFPSAFLGALLLVWAAFRAGKSAGGASRWAR